MIVHLALCLRWCYISSMNKTPLGPAQRALLAQAEKDTAFFGKVRCHNHSLRLIAERLRRRGLMRNLTYTYYELTPEGIEAAARLRGNCNDAGRTDQG